MNSATALHMLRRTPATTSEQIRQEIELFDTVGPSCRKPAVFSKFGPRALMQLKELRRLDSHSTISSEAVTLAISCFETLGYGLTTTMMQSSSPVQRQIIRSFDLLTYWTNFAVSRAYYLDLRLAWRLQKVITVTIWLASSTPDYDHVLADQTPIISSLARIWAEADRSGDVETQVGSTGSLRAIIMATDDAFDRIETFLDALDDQCFIATTFLTRIQQNINKHDLDPASLLDDLTFVWMLLDHDGDICQEFLAHELLDTITACWRRISSWAGKKTKNLATISSSLSCYGACLLVTVTIMDDGRSWIEGLLRARVFQHVHEALRLLGLNSSLLPAPLVQDHFNMHAEFLRLLSCHICHYSILRHLKQSSGLLNHFLRDTPEHVEIARRALYEGIVDRLQMKDLFDQERPILCRNSECEAYMSRKNNTYRRCSRCNVVFYCSSVCQKMDWPLHKDQCKLSRLDADHEPWRKQSVDHRDKEFFRFQVMVDLEWLRSIGGMPDGKEKTVLTLDYLIYPPNFTTHAADSYLREKCDSQQRAELDKYFKKGYTGVVISTFVPLLQRRHQCVFLSGIRPDRRVEDLRCASCACDHASMSDHCE